MKRYKGFIWAAMLIFLYGAAHVGYAQYQTKVYMDSGGDRQVVAAGGTVLVERGGKIIGSFSVSIDSFAVVKSATSDVTDSTLIVYLSSGNPVLSFRATDDDEANITINTSDKLLFTGASGGYTFDALAGFGETAPLTNTVTIGDGLTAGVLVTMEHVPAGTDSSFQIKMVDGVPVIDFFGSNGDTYRMTITTADAASFTGATGGYLFDAVIDGTDIANTTIGAGGASSGAFTTGTFSSTVDIDDAVTMPSFTLEEGTTTGNVDLDTSDAMNFTGASGGYLFDAVIDGTDIINTTIGAGGASSGAFTTITASGTITGSSTVSTGALTAAPSVSVKMSPTSDITDSNLTVTLPSGVPTLSFFGTDDDTYTISIDTDDKAQFSGASGGYLFDAVIDGTDIANTTIGAGGASSGAFTTGTFSGALTYLESVVINDTNETLDTALSGTTYVSRPLTAKRVKTLPTAAVGLNYTFFVADADSLRIIAASGDSIITSAGVADRAIGSVAGTVKLLAMDSVRWVMVNTLGTWTQDHGVE